MNAAAVLEPNAGPNVRAVAGRRAVERAGNPFDLDDDASYRRWRDWKLAVAPAHVDDLIVDVRDLRHLSGGERAALLERIKRANFALYRARVAAEDLNLAREEPDIARALGAQLGLHRLDANWLAGEDGISRIEVSEQRDGRGGFIPYTDRPIQWHTDGYYHPSGRRIHAMILHCVRPARSGGENSLLDHELAYIALRDANPEHIRALMQPDAMTIPARDDDDGVARAAQSGPVFSVAGNGDANGHAGSETSSLGGTGPALHMRYTARTRSIEWRGDAATRAALRALETLLAQDSPWIHRVRLQAGMGVVGHNVLHARTAFADDPAAPRLLYRARYLDRITGLCVDPRPPSTASSSEEDSPWRNG